MTEQLVQSRERKRCPICSEILFLTEFGVCRARKDGRNLYCRGCIRKKVADSRRALKAYKSVRRKYATQQVLETECSDAEQLEAELPQYVSRQISRMSPIERVREAIRSGARTQKEIAQETKLSKDEIGEALASLLLWTREIRTEVVKNTRMYFANDVSSETEAPQSQTEGLTVPPRKPDVPSSFSSLQVLMPGKNPEPEKIGGWEAA